MPVLGTFVDFTDTTPMDASDVSDVFINTATERAIYNILNELDNTNLLAGTKLPERLFQFLPFPGGGGHSHDGAPAGTPKVNSGAVVTSTILKSQSSLVFTGAQKILLNKGTVNVTVDARGTIGDRGEYGHANINVFTDCDFATPPAFSGSQWPVVVASVRQPPEDLIACHVFIERVTQPNNFRVIVFCDRHQALPQTYPVDYIVIGVRT